MPNTQQLTKSLRLQNARYQCFNNFIWHGLFLRICIIEELQLQLDQLAIAVEDTADSIVVAVPVAEEAATLQNLIDQGRSHEAASLYEADTLIDTVDYVDSLTDTDSDSDTVVEASPEVESEFSEKMKIETIVNSTWKQEFNWGNLVATHFKGQYFAVALSGLLH